MDYNVENCSVCFEIKNDFREKNCLSWKDVFEHNQFPELSCEIHMSNEQFIDPLLFIIYKEHSINKGQFFKHVITKYEVEKNQYKVIDNNYYSSVASQAKFVQKKNLTFHQKTIKDILCSQTSLISKFLCLILDNEWSNTTFIIQDVDSFKMVKATKYVVIKFG